MSTEDCFHIHHWPTTTPEAEEALHKIQNTHQVRPLPAYSTNGKKILPNKYRERLQSAIVEVQFTISHIIVNKKDIFGADIVNIDVLQPPQTLHIIRKNTKNFLTLLTF